MSIFRKALVGILASSALVFGGGAFAQSWPERTVTFIVPNPPGGSTDVIARNVAQHLTEALGQSFVVENRPGASGAIGAGLVARAPADGYTFLFGTTGQLASIQYLGVERTYDPETDLEPVIHVANAPIAVITNPALPVGDISELIDYLRENPGSVSYATPGVATTSHIGGEWFKQLLDIDIVHVPFRGSGPVTNDLVAGHMQLAFDSPVSSMPHIREGGLLALAVTSTSRFPGLPDVPTLQEEGIDMQIVLLFGVAAPIGVPQEIIVKLNQEIDSFLQLPETKDHLVSLGAEAVGGSPEAFHEFLTEERQRWKTMIESTGISRE